MVKAKLAWEQFLKISNKFEGFKRGQKQAETNGTACKNRRRMSNALLSGRY